MVAGSITEETTVAVPVERYWKAVFGEHRLAVLVKACAGFIDAVEEEGDGGPGCLSTLKLNPAVGENKTIQTRVLSSDAAALVLSKEVLHGGALSEELKKQVVEYKMEAAGEGATVVKVKVDYERHDGAALAPEDAAKVAQGFVRLIKMVEAYLVAHPDEFV